MLDLAGRNIFLTYCCTCFWGWGTETSGWDD